MRVESFFPFADVSLRFYFLHLEVLHLCTLEKKERRGKDTLDSSPALLVYLSKVGVWGGAPATQYICRLSSRACSIYGLCQSGITNIGLSAKDAVAAVKRGIPSLPLVARTFISNTAGVLMRTVAWLWHAALLPLWLLCGHG